MALIRMFRSCLGHRTFPLAVALIAIILTLPSLWVGWQMDDYFIRRKLVESPGIAGLPTAMMNVFSQAEGDVEHNREAIDRGRFPWWTNEKLLVNFWRPLSVVTHWIDHTLWPESHVLAHAQSIFWYALLAFVAALFYRRMMGVAWIAGLAALLYAIDDAHSHSVGWIANRNTMLSALFGLLALIFHDRWRRDGIRSASFLGPFFLLVGVMTGEGAAATGAYLLAYALFIDRAPWRGRLLALAPYVAIGIVWRLAYSALGYGAWGSGMYIDAGREPSRFLVALLNYGPALFQGQWALPWSDFYLGLTTRGARILSLMGVGLMLLVGAAMIPLLRRDAVARFWALGMMIALVPICSTYPMDRVLTFVGIGAFGLIAQFVGGLVERASWVPRGWTWRLPLIAFGIALGLVHLVEAPLVLPVRIYYVVGAMSPELEADAVGMPIGSDVGGKVVIILQGDFAFGIYYPDVRMLHDLPLPAHWRVLGPKMPVELTRIDERSLEVVPFGGFIAPPVAPNSGVNLSRRLEHYLRNPEYPIPLGHKVELTGMSVEVTEVNEAGTPVKVLYRFDVPLDDPSLVWLRFRRGRYELFHPPEVGRTVRVLL